MISLEVQCPAFAWLIAGCDVLQRPHIGIRAPYFISWESWMIPKWAKFSREAAGTRKLFSMLHPKQMLVLKCPTSLPVTAP